MEREERKHGLACENSDYIGERDEMEKKRNLIPHIDRRFALEGKMRDIEGKVGSVMASGKKHPPLPPPKKNLQGFPLFLRDGEGSNPSQNHKCRGGGESERSGRRTSKLEEPGRRGTRLASQGKQTKSRSREDWRWLEVNWQMKCGW